MRYPALAAVMASALISGCVSTPPVTAPERSPPVLCLAEPRTPIGATLPDWFDSAPLAEQLAALLTAHEQDVRAAAEREVIRLDCKAFFAP